MIFQVLKNSVRLLKGIKRKDYYEFWFSPWQASLLFHIRFFHLLMTPDIVRHLYYCETFDLDYAVYKCFFFFFSIYCDNVICCCLVFGIHAL